MSEKRSFITSLGTVRGGLTATASVITAVLGVIFLLVPSWRPLPRDKIAATVTVGSLEPHVTVQDWARRQYPRDHEERLRGLVGRNVLARDRRVPGLVVYVRLGAEGFKHRSVKLRARVYDADTDALDPDITLGLIYPKAGNLEIDAPSRSSVQLLLFRDFGVSGRWFVRVEAYDDDGILAYGDSKPIKIR